MISIVDIGICNVGSVLNMLDYLGEPARVVSKPKGIKESTKLILPGVGSFDAAVKALASRQLIEPIRRKAIVEGIPILGICLGMQVLTNQSSEGQRSGLRIIDGKTKSFEKVTDIEEVPHIGWNYVDIVNQKCIFKGIAEPRFYFVHSYYVDPKDKSIITSFAEYTITFPSSFRKENIFGVQFHPEKSHKFGASVLSNFASL